MKGVLTSASPTTGGGGGAGQGQEVSQLLPIFVRGCWISLEQAGQYLTEIFLTAVLQNDTFLFLNMLPRCRWWADSSLIAVNDHSSTGIDRCGWLSLQEATNKEEVKIYPFQHPVHVLALIQGHDPGRQKIHESNR